MVRDWEAMRDPVAEEPQFQLPAWIALGPFEQLCGMEIASVGDGRSHLRLPFRVKLSQGAGILHGGAMTALADTAVAMAIKSLVPPGTRFGTRELKTQFHAPVRRGWIDARAVVTRFEGRDIEAEAEMFDEQGRLVASFHTWLLLARGSRPGPAAD